MIKFKKVVTCDVPNCAKTAEMDYDSKNRNAIPDGWIMINFQHFCNDCADKLGLHEMIGFGTERGDVPETV